MWQDSHQKTKMPALPSMNYNYRDSKTKIINEHKHRTMVEFENYFGKIFTRDVDQLERRIEQAGQHHHPFPEKSDLKQFRLQSLNRLDLRDYRLLEPKYR